MKKTIRFYSTCSIDEKRFLRQAVWVFLSPLTKSYQGFDNWYANLFSSNELNKEREIIVCLYDNKIAGVAITKNSKDEKKLCTLKVADSMKGSGLAYELVTLAIRILEEDHPFCSINSEKESEFSRLFKYFGFKKGLVLEGESFWNME